MFTASGVGYFIYIQLHVRDVTVNRGKVDSLAIQHCTDRCAIGSVEFQFNGVLSAALQGNDQFVVQANGIGQSLSQVHFDVPDTLQLIGDVRYVFTDNLRINVTPIIIELNQTVVFFHNNRCFRRSGSGSSGRLFDRCHNRSFGRSGSGSFRRGSCRCLCRSSRGRFGRSRSRSFRRGFRRSRSRGFRRSSRGRLGRCGRRRFSRSFRRCRSRRLGRSRRRSLGRRGSRSFRRSFRRSLRRRFNRSDRHFGPFIFCIHHSRAGNQQGDSAQDGENLLELLHHIFTPPILLGD